MDILLKLLTQLYQHLLRLYPRSVQEEFSQEMLSDFSDLAFDASKKGALSLLIFCLRELWDFPINLLRSYLEETQTLRILRSQPFRSGIRGAIGFGLGFGIAAVTIWMISNWMTSTFDSRLSALSVWIFDVFHSNRGMSLLWNILSLISSALTGLVFGLLLALFAGSHSNYARYALVGGLGWFIPVAISSVLSDSFSWSFYLSPTQSYVLGLALDALTGAFLGAIFYIAESNHRNSLRWMASGIILYPFAVTLYTKFLFYLWFEITAWFFPALMILMMGLLGSIFTIAGARKRKTPWGVIVGAVAYPILVHSIYQIAYHGLNLPAAGPGETITSHAFLVYETTWAGVQGFSGLLFGWVLGFVWGVHNNNNSPQVTA